MFRKGLLVGLVVWVALAQMGCKKKPCYHCYDFGAGFMATKSGDTVWVGTIISRIWLQDSINRYLSMGYKIDTVIGGYHPDPDSGAIVCDINSVYKGQPVPDSCAEII